MKRSRKTFLLALGTLVLALVSFLFSKETIRGIIRQRTDESVAEEYIQEALWKEEEEKTSKQTSYISDDTETDEAEKSEEKKHKKYKKIETERAEETVESTETFIEERTEKTVKDEGPSYIPVEDEAYYERGGVVYTPEYAVGRIDCVLEIPCISLRRCVYTGTAEEIEADLDMWFTVSASPDLIPGKTHYAIFGHNHTVQNLSFNRLAEVSLGDYFTLTRDTEVYIYLVTDMLAAERSTGRAAYAYNDALDPTLCYIFTCGRDYMLLDGVSTRYKDLIVEGTLWRTVPLSLWLGEEELIEKNETEASGESPRASVSRFHDALESARESIRASKPAPVLTVRAEGNVFASQDNVSEKPLSWAMIQVGLTLGCMALSAVLFVAALIFRIAEAVSERRDRALYPQ